ncbi:hypothetical protein I552_9654 [Mycobacterium xenopi 3993]|nr:hypothetical protein I552_9654 [Mycobacterium xenopi 3993]
MATGRPSAVFICAVSVSVPGAALVGEVAADAVCTGGVVPGSLLGCWLGLHATSEATGTVSKVVVLVMDRP